MFALNNKARAVAIANLPLTRDMQPSILMSRMLGLFPASHEPCFFLRAASLKRLPAEVQAHLVQDRTSDPLTLALCADEIFQSHVSSASAVNHISSPPVLRDDFPVHAIPPQSAPCSPCAFTPGPSSRQSPASPSASCRSNSPSLCWYHRHGDQAPCSWPGNKLAGRKMHSLFLPVILVLLSSISRTFSHLEGSWSTPVPLFQFSQLLLQPPALGYSWLQLMAPPVLVPGLFLYVLVPTGLTVFFSWLQCLFPSLEQTFSAITVFSWMYPTRECFAWPHLVPLRAASPLALLLRPCPLVSVLPFSPLLSASPTSSPSFLMSSLPMGSRPLNLAARSVIII